MKTANGYKAFGWASFMPYEFVSDDWEELKNVRNDISKDDVIAYIQDIDFGAAAMKPYIDKETGDRVECGVYVDGVYRFPAEFVYYFKRGIVGLPKEYEQHIIGQLGKGS